MASRRGFLLVRCWHSHVTGRVQIWIAAGKDGLARLEGSRWRTIGPDWGFAEDRLYRFRGSRRHSLGGDADQRRISRRGRTPVSDRCTTASNMSEDLPKRQTARCGWQKLGYGVRRVPLPGKQRAVPAVLVGSLAITFDNQGSLWITSLGPESVECHIRSVSSNRS